MSKFYEHLKNCSPESLPELSPEKVPAGSHRRIARLVKQGIKQKDSASVFNTKPSFGKIAVAAAMVAVISVGAVMLPFNKLNPDVGNKDVGNKIDELPTNGELNVSSTVDGVTLTAERVMVKDDGYTYIHAHIEYPEVQGEYIMCELISLYSGKNVLYNITGPTPETALKSLFAGDIIFYTAEDGKKNTRFDFDVRLERSSIPKQDLVLEMTNFFTLDFDGISLDDEYTITPIIDKISVTLSPDALYKAFDSIKVYDDMADVETNTTVTVGDVTLTALDLTTDGEYGYLKMRLDYPEAEGQFLTFERMNISSGKKNLYKKEYVGVDKAFSAVLAGDYFKYLGTNERTGCEFIQKFELPSGSNKVTLTIDNLYTIYHEGDRDNAKGYLLADHIELTVGLDEIPNKVIQTTTLNPNTTIEFGNTSMKISEVTYNGLGVVVKLELPSNLIESPVEGIKEWRPINWFVLPTDLFSYSQEQRSKYFDLRYDFNIFYIGGNGVININGPIISDSAEIENISGDDGETTVLTIRFNFDTLIPVENLRGIYITQLRTEFNTNSDKQIEIFNFNH